MQLTDEIAHRRARAVDEHLWHGGAAVGQREFLAWLNQVLPAPVSDGGPSGQELLEAVAYVMLQAALWDLEGVSSREDSQLTKRLKGWAAALALPLRSRALGRSMGAAGRERVLSRYSAEGMARAVEAAYREVAGLEEGETRRNFAKG